MWRATPRAHQEAATTASRRAQPRAWLRAVAWLVGTGMHPRANATTERLAADLARRMDYTQGRVLYDLTGTAARLNLSVPTIKRHARILRECGLLVWLEHGTRRNLHLPGRKWAGTATVYGAAIPPAYDTAMGHRTAGTSYDDRRVVGVTEAGRERAVQAANEAAADRRCEGREPPSLGRYPNVRKAQVSGGLKDTRVACASSSTPKTTTTARSSKGRTGRSKGRSTGRPPLQVARDIRIAQQVRPRVAWAQRESLRRLAFALRPLIDQGHGPDAIAAELHSWWLDWRPARPAAYITTQLRHQAARDAELPANPTGPTQQFLAATNPTPPAADDDGDPGISEGHIRLEDLPPETVIALRSEALGDPSLVLAAIENLGMRDARRLYTGRLVDQALARTFRVSDHTVIHSR